jgi:hypothetical protein
MRAGEVVLAGFWPLVEKIALFHVSILLYFRFGSQSPRF